MQKRRREINRECKEIPLKAKCNRPGHPYVPFRLLLSVVVVVSLIKHIKMNSVVEAKYFWSIKSRNAVQLQHF